MGQTGILIGTAAPVRQPLNAAFLIAVKDFVPYSTGILELPANFGHSLAGLPASHKLAVFRPLPTLLPWHHSLPKKREKCNFYVSVACKPPPRKTLLYLLFPRRFAGSLQSRTSDQPPHRLDTYRRSSSHTIW